MKTRFRSLARRPLEGALRLLRKPATGSKVASHLDGPIEMASEVIDLATGELLGRSAIQRGDRRR